MTKLSKNIQKTKTDPITARKDGVVEKILKMTFSDVPETMFDTRIVMDDGTTRYVYPLLRWARASAQMFDDEIVLFITVAGMKNVWHKGDFVVLQDLGVKKGDSIALEKHIKFGWRPTRV